MVEVDVQVVDVYVDRKTAFLLLLHTAAVAAVAVALLVFSINMFCLFLSTVTMYVYMQDICGADLLRMAANAVNENRANMQVRFVDIYSYYSYYIIL
jgi:hypothetical protein